VDFLIKLLSTTSNSTDELMLGFFCSGQFIRNGTKWLKGLVFFVFPIPKDRWYKYRLTILYFRLLTV
jgi:hypothetical protein